MDEWKENKLKKMTKKEIIKYYQDREKGYKPVIVLAMLIGACNGFVVGMIVATILM